MIPERRRNKIESMQQPSVEQDLDQSPAPPPVSQDQPLRERIGVCQWFHFEDRREVDRTLRLLNDLGARHLRTGISWADYHRSGGRAWYDWQMARLRESGVEVLLSVWHTPPSISEGSACNAPPKRLRDYADFIDRIIGDYGDSFEYLELWNEPNNRYKWDFATYDPDWSKFAAMIADAAHWAHQCGKRTVLGGMIPVDPHWLQLIRQHGGLESIDVVGIHGFPGMWFPHHPNWDWYDDWHGWDDRLQRLAPVAQHRPIWVTETGFATWDLALGRQSKHELQCDAIRALPDVPAQRIYIYCLTDLDPERDAIEGFHVDENEYHMGLVHFDGSPKPAFHLLQRMLNLPQCRAS